VNEFKIYFRCKQSNSRGGAMALFVVGWGFQRMKQINVLHDINYCKGLIYIEI